MLTQDLRFAVRAMRKSPVFSAIAISTLALGIGANTAIFSIVRNVLLRPLAYQEPDRLVTIQHRGTNPASAADFLDWQQQSRSFSQMAGAGGWFATLTGRDRPEQIVGLQVSDGMFSMLGVPPLYGRTPSTEESQPGKDRVVVLGYGLWQRLFSGDRGIIGQAITLNGAPYTVIGVMPQGFQFTPFWITNAEIWSPLTLADKASNRWAHFLRPFGRLKPGVTLADAQAEMDVITKRLENAYPDTNTGMTVRVDPLQEKVVGSVRPALLMLLGAVGFVMLIACTNTANLALARTAERRKEIGIRLALGADRARLLRQLLTESVLFALIGGALGLALAFWGVDALKAVIQQGSNRINSRLPRIQEVGLDGMVLGFTALLSLATGIMFGLFPAFQAARTNVNDSLKEGGRAVSERGHSLRLRSVLIVSEVAVSLVLLAGAGLLVRSFLALRAIDPGFDPQHVLTMTVSVAGQPHYAGERREAFYRTILEQTSALPGVESASMINHLPIGGDVWGTNVYAEGRALPPPGQNINSNYRVCRPGYLRTMHIPLLKGRDFAANDVSGSPRVAIINEKLAKTLWPADDPIGKRFSPADPRTTPSWLAVVGVVRDVKQSSWSAKPANEFYIPFQQDAGFFSGAHPWVTYMTLVVRTAGDPLSLAGAVQRTIWWLNKDVPISDVRSMEQVIAGALWQAHFQGLIVGLFAAFAMLLAAIGIYGVMTYSVTRRTQEIGIRVALGARPANVVWLILKQAVLLVAAGLVLGLSAAFALTRLVSKLLYGISPADPVTFIVVPLALAAIALVASYLPARRATKVDPVIALRAG